MTAPGVIIQVQTASPPRSVPTDSGVAFMAGLCDQGALAPILVRNLDQFVQTCGARVSYSILYDTVDAFFHEGGNAVWISRVVGPGALSSSFNINDAQGTPQVSLVAKANAPGAWGSNLKVAVLAGLVSGYRIQVLLNNVVVETSTDLATQQDGVTWAAYNSKYITLTIGASAQIPAVAAAASLTGGTDDRSNIGDAQWLAALNLFTKDLGPGQVMCPGRTSDVGHQQLTDHAATHNRDALLDLPDVALKSTLESSASGAKTTGNGQYAAPFTPWIVIPGVQGIAGTTRVVPPCGSVAGVIARVDASDNPNTPAAAEKGRLRYALGLSQPGYTDTDRDELNNAGINVIRNMNNGIEIYGWRSLADPINLPSWLDFSNVRYLMWLASRCDEAGQSFVFAPIDGQGHKISDYGAAMAGLCQKDWNDGMLYGRNASEAFNVDVGDSVNTEATIAARQLRAVVAVRPSPDAELVTVIIVDVPVAGTVS